MRKLTIYLAVMIASFTLLFGVIRSLPFYRCSADFNPQVVESSYVDDTLKVAIIGDSWAALHRPYDNSLESMLLDSHSCARVYSRGFPGAKSRDIYQEMVSSIESLQRENLDYGVLFAGINDAVTLMGNDFYVYHYLLMVRLLLNLGIKPVVVDMPDVNYHAVAGREPLKIRAFHYFSSFITGARMYDYSEYRSALKDELQKTYLLDSVVYINAEAWNADGYRDKRGLYMEDETHLNALGYHVLDSCIVSNILRDMNKR